MREKLKQRLKPSRNLLVPCVAEKNLLQLRNPGWTFSFKKYKPNKDDNVLKGDIRKIDDIYFYLNCFP